MFDIGFWEVVLFFMAALIVVGPERLPRLARTAGIWIGKAKRVVAEVKDEVDRELRIEEIRQSVEKQDALKEMRQLANRVKAINSDVQQEVTSIEEKKPNENVSQPQGTVDLDKKPDVKADQSDTSSDRSSMK